MLDISELNDSYAKMITINLKRLEMNDFIQKRLHIINTLLWFVILVLWLLGMAVGILCSVHFLGWVSLITIPILIFNGYVIAWGIIDIGLSREY